MSRTVYHINSLPKTLEKITKLSKITGIEITTSYKANFYQATHEFLTQELPSMKYYNPNFYYKKIIKDTQKTPKYKLFYQHNKVLSEFQPEKMTSEEIMKKIMEYDAA